MPETTKSWEVTLYTPKGGMEISIMITAVTVKKTGPKQLEADGVTMDFAEYIDVEGSEE